MTIQETRNRLAAEIRRVKAFTYVDGILFGRFRRVDRPHVIDDYGIECACEMLDGLRFAADNIECVDQRRGVVYSDEWVRSLSDQTEYVNDSRGLTRKRRSGCVADREKST